MDADQIRQWYPESRHALVFTTGEDAQVSLDLPGDLSIPEILDYFKTYLLACGYIFDPYARLELIEEGGSINGTNHSD